MFNPGDPCKTIRVRTSDLRKIYKNLGNPVTFFRISEEDTVFMSNDEY